MDASSKKISDLISYLVTEDQTELLEVLLILLQYSAECTGEINQLYDDSMELKT
jgi:hypothetical protein